MPLIMLDFDKPNMPAMMAPVFQCKTCGKPIKAARDGGAYWYTDDREDGTVSTPIEYAHRGDCFFQATDGVRGPGVLMDMQLDQLIAALPV